MDESRGLFLCKESRLAAFSCPHCNAHVHRGETSCAQCGLDLSMMAQQFRWGPVLFNRGLQHARRGEYESAVPFLHRARTLMPDRPEPFVLLAKLEAYRGEYDAARSWFSDAREAGLVSEPAWKSFQEALDQLAEERPHLLRHAVLRPFRRRRKKEQK